MAINAIIRFLQAARSMAQRGMKKEQILDFARREFGEVSKLLRKQIDDIFKAKPKTEKKGEVVPIKADEGIMAADAATEIVKKRTKDIAKGDVTGETSDLMKGLEDKAKEIKKAADELKKVADEPAFSMEIAEGPQKGKKITIDDFFAMTGKARDPRTGVVRAAAREILEKNKIKIGREDPIEVLRQMYGEKGLEAIDAVSDGLLDAQTYGEMNTILTQNKLFDLVPKKTYGYDQSVVSAEKIRKAKEQEAKQKKILEDFDIDPDRDPNAHGGIIGNLRLNRTGFGIGSVPKGFKLAKRIRDSKEYKDFIEMLFIKASNMIRQGKGMFKNLDESQRIKQHDNLTNEVTNFQKTGELPESVHQYFGMNPEVAYAETLQKVSTVEKSREKVRNFKKLQEFDPGGRKPNAHGGLINILKL